MKTNKYLPFVIVVVFACILIPFLTGGDNGKYIVSYEEVNPAKIKLA